ncbi:MAG TPA: GNAT family N-acetyltransferase [Acidimicrobiales bacterium]|nr:GNAT family N-acetyltransferase [Acidimicrobiales bacterium]
MSGTTLRDMADEEVDEVARLLVAANREHLGRFPAAVADAYLAEVVRVAERRSFSEVIVAEAGGCVVGAVTFLPDAAADGHPWPPGGAVLRLLAVDPAARNRGVGEALTVACVERARAGGARFLGLHTAAVMVPAGRLYERLGFRRAPEHDFDPGLHYGGEAGPGAGGAWGLAYVLDLGAPPGRARS